jgi:dipeptidyl aminopeptidase/acylaminoacyl peptidase
MSTSTVASPLRIEELYELRGLSDASISDDGRRVACVVSETTTGKGGAPEARIWISDAGAPAREVTRGPGRDGIPRFSPDGRLLAFASDRSQPGLASLHLLDFAGEARPLGEIRGLVEEIAWSRDSLRLLVLAADPGADLAGAQSAVKVAERGAEVSDIVVRRPGQAWRRLYWVDVATGATTEVSPEGLNVWEVGWSGDGPAVAVVSDEPTESAWYIARVALLDLEARTARDVYTTEWQLQSPVISPDKRHVAFVEGFNSDRTVIAGTTTVVSLASGAVTTLAEDRDVVTLRWLAGGDLFGAGLAGLQTMCVRMSLDGAVEELWQGPATLGQTHRVRATCSADGRRVASPMSSPKQPQELMVLDLEAQPHAWRQLTSVNATFVGRGTPTQQAYEWQAEDGLRIEGLLLRPEGLDGPLPLVVIVHGGPTNAFTMEYNVGYFGFGIGLGNAGYAVLLPNPRGSSGRGQPFARANIGDMGGGDLGDILAGVDALVADGIVDRDRVGITGASYGGFMSAWAITQSDAFAASIPCACVSNWLSFHNTSNIGRFDELFLQSDPYDPTGDYFSRSPVVHARGVTTPTLILHGELDLCTPLGQAQEMYQALADAGAETELVVYPRGGHGWVERDHLRDTFDRGLAWFNRHLAGDREAVTA